MGYVLDLPKAASLAVRGVCSFYSVFINLKGWVVPGSGLGQVDTGYSRESAF